ncbi:hypothetical protein B0H13DRAFT_2371315 [Mycena leptocephala]|nr:hypothetical protein B0H13DRAFT_2371315 [Mycena leptocephala]
MRIRIRVRAATQMPIAQGRTLSATTVAAVGTASSTDIPIADANTNDAKVDVEEHARSVPRRRMEKRKEDSYAPSISRDLTNPMDGIRVVPPPPDNNLLAHLHLTHIRARTSTFGQHPFFTHHPLLLTPRASNASSSGGPTR